MKMRKVHTIEKQLEIIEQRLANAEEYLAKNVNVEGTSFLHLQDWDGKSGHPLWMRNHMVPTTMKYRAKREKIQRKNDDKAKDKDITTIKRMGVSADTFD